MARRMFAVVDVVELLRHSQAGDNVSQMARLTAQVRTSGMNGVTGCVPDGLLACRIHNPQPPALKRTLPVVDYRAEPDALIGGERRGAPPEEAAP